MTKIPLINPDATFYEEIKKIKLEILPVQDHTKTTLPLPKSLKYIDHFLLRSWKNQHGSMIEVAYRGNNNKIPFRSIFPGPYIPWLSGKMDIIGDTAYSIFLTTIKSVKQRVPNLSQLHKTGVGYTYENSYYPVIHKISEPEEGWILKDIECPVIDGVYFPLPVRYNFQRKDRVNLHRLLKFINRECGRFYEQYMNKRRRSIRMLREIISLIRCVQYLHTPHIRDTEIDFFNEILTCFEIQKKPPANPTELLFEIDHAVSYLYKLRNKDILLSGIFGMSWIDVIKLPIENLLETELADIERVLREVRSFFSVGWAPILVHLSGDHAYNTDGTHRHYAFLTIELLRRLKNRFKKPIREININSKKAVEIILEFSWRYKKVGLSLRETLRTVNYLVNSDTVWPYLNFLEQELEKIKNIEFQYIPVVYLPEWRARTVVKNLCDKGIALVGVPPINIEIVGSSNGKKGIFIRGGYHGDDRQPSPWFNITSLQKLYDKL